MKRKFDQPEDRYEIVIRKLGAVDPVETDVMSDSQTQEVLYFIGRLQK